MARATTSVVVGVALEGGCRQMEMNGFASNLSFEGSLPGVEFCTIDLDGFICTLRVYEVGEYQDVFLWETQLTFDGTAVQVILHPPNDRRFLNRAECRWDAWQYARWFVLSLQAPDE